MLRPWAISSISTNFLQLSRTKFSYKSHKELFQGSRNCFRGLLYSRLIYLFYISNYLTNKLKCKLYSLHLIIIIIYFYPSCCESFIQPMFHLFYHSCYCNYLEGGLKSKIAMAIF